ncbi:hypothetical protein COX69_00465 [Candidatus Falkowbacteria bacterium CG_4_10_14_0_2_um_filter_48_10]|nr:MAG: hypothetical protein COX69_00465 [Candidatus Falkowbacteria bacterium CG_4_10_14_0_2_um_filter_48_10]
MTSEPPSEGKKIDLSAAGESSLSEFVRRRLPSEKEVEAFEGYVEQENKEEEIKESLNEIYNGTGQETDIKRLERRKKRGFLFWFFSFLIFSFIAASAAYSAYYYIFTATVDASALELRFFGRETVRAAEEFNYEIYLKNNTNSPLLDGRLEVAYPENYIFYDASRPPAEKKSIWLFARLGVGEEINLRIRGALIDAANGKNVANAAFTYHLENFSSEFKKETSWVSTVSGPGFTTKLDYLANILVNDKNEVKFIFSPEPDNRLSAFRLVISPAENISFDPAKSLPGDKNAVSAGADIWLINLAADTDTSLLLPLTFTKKLNAQTEQEVPFRFEYEDPDGKWRPFYRDQLKFAIMKNDLNMVLLLNGSRANQAVDFGQDLHYAVSYANKGESELKDVVIMAVLNGEYLDWASLETSSPGKEKGNFISWSKSELPALAAIGAGQEGVIDFSLKVKTEDQIKPGVSHSLEAYAQFNIGEQPKVDINAENRSNVIIATVNSDLKLQEEIRYFNADNIAVGTGPLPPRVGEQTTFKVYWTIKNNLHDLTNIKVNFKLPLHMEWAEHERTSAGNIYYQPEERAVIWEISRLPVAIFRSDAEFSLSLTPTAENLGKIIVISNGAKISALDNETNQVIEKSTKPKTTKLEDDSIAQTDGLIR